MSAKPWFAWYPADYRAKTAHLSFCESEAYRRLLEAYYERRGPVPADKAALHRLAGAQTDDEREAVAKVAGEFFHEKQGKLHHQRCDEEIGKAQSAHERWVEGGRKGGLSSAQARLEANLEAPLKPGSSNPQPQPQSHITVTPTITSKEPTPRQNGAALPDWIPNEAWQGFIEMRKKIRAPMTNRAQDLLVKTLDKLRAAGQQPADVLNQSVENSWRGVFPLKAENGKPAQAPKPAPECTYVDRPGAEPCGMPNAKPDPLYGMKPVCEHHHLKLARPAVTLDQVNKHMTAIKQAARARV